MDDEIDRLGADAYTLLSHPAFAEAVAQYRGNLSDAFFASTPDDVAGRERLFALRLCLDAVLGNLQALYAVAHQRAAQPEHNGD